MTTERYVEVFADVGCPFTHIGLRRFVERRAQLGRDDVRLWVRAWPLEIVNGKPLDPHFIAEEIDEIRPQVATDLFGGFVESAFPDTTMPAMALAALAYDRDLATGELVSLAVRDAVFEHGDDVTDPAVLAAIADAYDLDAEAIDPARVQADHTEGVERGVVGSPHFFTLDGAFFCPSLDVSRNEHGQLQVVPDAAAFDAFVASCLR
jgi:predicted DsbA family dithiol-disulfide isomerase